MVIGITRDVKFMLEDRLVDPEGWFIFVRGKIRETEYTLANVYCPNQNRMVYLIEILGKLMECKKGKLILAGDLNYCMDPREDWETSTQESNKKRYQCQLVDVWGIQHPGIKDYTFYSPVHGTYSRLYYIMVEHRLLVLVPKLRTQ